MGTAVLVERRRVAVSPWTVAPTAPALVRVRWTPYWFAADGCVERAGEWTLVTAEERGFMRLSTRFAPERIVEHGRRCDDG